MIFTAVLGTSPCGRRQTLLLRLGVLGYQVGDSRLMGVGFRGGCGCVHCCSGGAGGERVSVFLIALEGLPVGPFGLQGPVEPFHFPVPPGAVWADEHMFVPSLLQQLGQRETARI